jgi:hypothetical protein
MNQVNNATARLSFDNARKLMQSFTYPDGRQIYDLSSAKLTQSYIRSEVALSATQAAYHIPILVNDTQNGAVRVCEKRLNLQDIFVTNQLSILVGVGASTNTKPPLFSYNDQTTFTSATDDDLLSMYNGSLNLIINNEQVLPGWDVLRHYKVPNIQAIAAVYYASTPTQLNQLDLSTDSFYPVEPGFVLNGAANLQMTLQCPGAPATVLTNSFICVIQRGILLQNVTTVK